MFEVRVNRDQYFLSLAEAVAARSKDPSTKVGAVLVDLLGRVVSTGYNGFPQCMRDHSEHYADREQKYSRIIHAEMNAVLFAGRDLHGCTVYTWPFLSCDRCAVHLLQAGVTRFVTRKCALNSRERWDRWEPVFEKTRAYIKECDAACDEILLSGDALNLLGGAEAAKPEHTA